MEPAKLAIVCSLIVLSNTFLNKLPGWAKSQLGWLGLCLATSPVTLYGSYLASLLNLKVFSPLLLKELGS